MKKIKKAMPTKTSAKAIKKKVNISSKSDTLKSQKKSGSK
jgi:hypothetical protein